MTEIPEILGLDFIICTKEFYEKFKRLHPNKVKEKDGKCYILKYRCEFVSRMQENVRTIGHVNKPSKQEFMDAKYKRKNFAKDYLMKGKKWR